MRNLARYLSKEVPEITPIEEFQIAIEARTDRIANVMAKNPFEGMTEKELKATKNRKIDDWPHEYTLYQKYMPIIKKNYPKNEMTLMKHIRDYKNRNADKLLTIYPYDYPVYGNEDMMIIYRVTGIDPNELAEDVKKIKIPTVTHEVKEKKNFRPDLVLLLMLYEYYLVEMKAAEMFKADIILQYIGYAMYWSVYNKFFIWKPNHDQVRYSIDTATNKFILRDPAIHSIDNLIRYCVGGPIINNVSLLYDPFDLSYAYIIDGLKTSLTGKMKTIFNKIRTDSEQDPNNRIFISKDDPESFGESRSTSLDVQQLAMKYSTKFLSQATIQPECIEFACGTTSDVSEKALKITMQTLIDTCPQKEVQSFFESMFYLYITDPEIKDPDLLNKKKFILSMNRIFKKGHTKNKNDNEIKRLLDKWLIMTNPTFATATREATQTNYRKAVFMYFTYYVSIT